MRIVCPSCETSYEITADSLGEAGRSVRCARCKMAWFAAAPAPELALAAEWDDAPDAQGDVDPVGQTVGPIGHSTAIALASAADTAPLEQQETIEYAALGPPLVPATEWEAAAEVPPADAPHEDIETVAARRAPPPVERRRRSFRFRPSIPLVILCLAAVLAALAAWRTEVVRFAPQTASLFAHVGLPVNLRGLTFDAVKLTGETHEGVPVMVIDGVIVNAAKTAVEVPRMRFALRNQAGLEVYAWTALPTRSFLNEGESLPFRTRLASPPADARDVQVRFFNRRDLETGR
jgi:predicted Zn finger-like uncharacterized protein